jgi:hypothetical protein
MLRSSQQVPLSPFQIVIHFKNFGELKYFQVWLKLYKKILKFIMSILCVDNQNYPFLWSCQNVKRTSPLRSSHRDDQKTYMKRLIRGPDKEVMPREDALLLKASTRVGSSDTRREFWQTSEVPTFVGSFDPTSDSTSDRPNTLGLLLLAVLVVTKR